MSWDANGSPIAPPLYGWWSDMQYERHGSKLWSRPDGTHVAVTLVSPTEEHRSGWKDIFCLGEVVSFIPEPYRKGWPKNSVHLVMSTPQGVDVGNAFADLLLPKVT